MIRSIFITTIVASFTYLLVGWLIFDLLLGSYTNLNTTQIIGFKKSEMNWSLLIISCFSYALLITLILKNASFKLDIKKGFLASGLVGILVAIMTDLYWHATSNFFSNFTVIVLDIVGAGLSVGCMGAMATLVMQKQAAKTSV